MHARFGTYIHDIIGGAHGILVVLHHDERIAQIAQMHERIQKFFVVPLMQSDARLVENI